MGNGAKMQDDLNEKV